ncbi:MAG: alpha-1,6-glucosidase [Chloroflexota bacterium]|nr:MAG: alpha-1,6-glucosidase [Chloroflexota bacterium]
MLRKWMSAVVLTALLAVGYTAAQENKDGFPIPQQVVIPGSHQDEVGCPGEWQPACEATALTLNPDTGLWEGTFNIPAGSYEYKVALDGGWDRNYGAGAAAGGPNIPLVLDADTDVTFTYDHTTGVVTDSVNGGVSAVPDAQPAVVIPTMVNIPGTIQPGLGCPGEWAPDCPATVLDYVEPYQIFERTFDMTAGSYEYKVAINGSWGENYGGFADRDGPNIPLNLTEDRAVTFLYDPATKWIMDDVRHLIVTAPGSFQSELGCAEDWMPDCMLSWLKDVDGDGIYTFSTSALPAGDYEAKAAIGRTWDVNYGAGGEAGGANIAFNVSTDGETVNFTFDSNLNVMVITAGGGSVTGANLRERRAHWVTADTIAWDIEPSDSEEYRLLYSADGSIEVSVFGISGDFVSYPVSPSVSGLPDAVQTKFPHLAGYQAFTLSAEAIEAAPDILRGQFAIAAYSGDTLVNLAGLQIPGVLDDLYTYDGDLGVTIVDGVPTLSVWAPTAQSVALNLYADAGTDTASTVIDMARDDATGVWSVTGEAGWMGQFYTYTVRVFAPTELAMVDNEVTDPYSINLSQNSRRSQIVDLSSPDLMPEGWLTYEKPDYGDAFEDITIYELHIRDFSIFDQTVPEDLRGAYLAFTVDDSAGMQHLKALAQAGLTHLHLLPSFDIATINENRARHFEPDYDLLASLPPDSPEQQAAYDRIRDLDGFNWGYDPYHYMAPEGSYATEATGTARILEYREMVKAINEAGLRVVQDVVFNHTNASGQSARSVLDRVVPGYYHRLDAAGQVTRSTCCENTATEHNMMRRLMIDTVVLNAVQYKIDGFRFDLMGHHMVSDMIAVREALDALTLEAHGVDGKSIYIYGEGWDFGEVQNGARGVNATQFNLAGTGIGTFSDRLRDAVRGGSPFGGRDEQGLGNGIYTDPNGLNPVNEDLARVLRLTDLVRVGLAGNLRDYQFVGASGETITGFDTDYNGSPGGYTLDPQEQIVYVSKHDNETLFDNMLFRLPPGSTADDIVRMQNLSLSYVLYAQGVPFLQAGSDLLRSKSLDRNSYNSGDWFNRIDWTGQTNNFGVGLPPAADNQERWETMAAILTNEDYYPTPDHIALNAAVVREMLQIRYSSPLFRLRTADAIQARLSFLNTGPDQQPGVIAMNLSDLTGEDIDPAFEQIVVIFNGSDESVTIGDARFAGGSFELHPVQQASADAVAQTATFDDAAGMFTVPALTTSVFVVNQ